MASSNNHTLGEQKFSFEMDWYDPQADIIRKLRLFYFPVTKSIEMYDIKNKRPFLNRVEYPSLALDDMFIGS